MIQKDIILPFYHNGDVIFHIRLIQEYLYGCWIKQLYSSIPEEVIRITHPRYDRALSHNNSIGDKSSMLYLEKLGSKLKDSSIATEFYYPNNNFLSVENSSDLRKVLSAKYQFDLSSQDYFDIHLNPIHVMYFRNYMKLSQLLQPKVFKAYIKRIDQITFESHLRAFKLREAYANLYRKECYFQSYQDQYKHFFVQFDLTGFPLLIYAP